MEQAPKEVTELNKTSGIKSTYILFIIAILIALAALVIGLLNFNHIQQQRIVDDEQISRNIEVLQTKLNDTEKQISLFAQTQQPASNQWHLMQAYYLTQLAYYHLQIEQSPSVAKKILQAAVLTIEPLNAPQYVTIKQLFSNKIIELQATPDIPYQTLLEKINAIDTLIDKMPISPTQKSTPQKPETKKQKHHKKHSFKEKAWAELKSLIIIRRHDQPVAPLLPEQEQVYLLQNIHLLLHQAQWAILNRQPTIFNETIKKIISIVSQHYVVDNAIVNAVLLNLGQLQTINLTPNMPDLTPLLNQLNTLVTQTNMQISQINTHKAVS